MVYFKYANRHFKYFLICRTDIFLDRFMQMINYSYFYNLAMQLNRKGTIGESFGE